MRCAVGDGGARGGEQRQRQESGEVWKSSGFFFFPPFIGVLIVCKVYSELSPRSLRSTPPRVADHVRGYCRPDQGRWGHRNLRAFDTLFTLTRP